MIFPMYYNNFPYSNRYRYPPYTQPTRANLPITQSKNFISSNKNYSVSQENTSINQTNIEKEDRDLSDEPWFDLFGIKLYFDDILIICLLFFLYTEGVQDQSLFIALIMLLLS